MEKIIHLIPLGYESDRAIKPFQRKEGFRANLVYILSTVEENGTSIDVVEKHKKYVNQVKTELNKLDIEVKIINLNTIDLLEVITKISYIIDYEKRSGNIVYVNMSSAGRLTSVGATLAGMVHGAKVYYVESDDYSDTREKWDIHGMTIVNNVRIRFLENFKINLPNEMQLEALVFIYKNKEVGNIEILEHLSKKDIVEFKNNYYKLSRKDKTALLMKLNRRIIEPLEQLGYIEKSKFGRDNVYSITESGKYIASISGLE